MIVKKIKIICILGLCVMMMKTNTFAVDKNFEQEKVVANEYEDENENNANSWRYKNGKPIEDTKITKGRSAKAYKEYITWPTVKGMIAKGIDVGRWNGSVDWNKAKASGVDYAIIQCGYGQDDVSQDDPMWKRNADACTKEEIPFGVYIYSYATNTDRARSEAKHVLRLIKGYKLSYPVYYDLEEESVGKKLSKAEIANVAQAFCEELEKEGYQVGIYANTTWSR